MSNYSIAFTGLNAAQQGLDITGNNIANAATEGYHRQRVDFAPAYASVDGPVMIGGGVKIKNISRIVDDLLEKEIYRQQSLLSQTYRESATLNTIENAFGELSSSDVGLNAFIDKFFNSLQDLAAHPGESIWQNQLITDAQAMTGQFKTLGDFLVKLDAQIRIESENVVNNINSLSIQIAELNENIQKLEIKGSEANNLRDQRDQYISELSQLVTIETQAWEYGVVNVNLAGIPLVMNSIVSTLNTGLDDNGKLAIAITGTTSYTSNIQGGTFGGLLALKNTIIPDLKTNLDALASSIMQQINQFHVQGVGSAGSFTQLNSLTMPDEDLADFTQTVTDGKLNIRLTNTSTGAITRSEIDIDASADTLTTIAAKIDAVTGLTASVSSSILYISADTNYEFDFLPAVLPAPKVATLNLNGAAPPTVTVSGIYSGSTNQTFTFDITGTGQVGNGTLQITVTDGSSNTVTTFDVGAGYAAGDKLDLGNGIKIALSMGDLVNADSFQVDTFYDTDTSGFLNATGINTFFTGTDAASISVAPDIINAPNRIATALGADMTDNTNASRLAAVRDLAVTSLNSLSCSEFYKKMVTDLGQMVSQKKLKVEHFETMAKNLANQQSQISGININEEAAQLLVFEQMFQAMAKYMNIIQSTNESIMSMM